MKKRNVLTRAGGGGRALSGTSGVTDSQPAKYRTGLAGVLSKALASYRTTKMRMPLSAFTMAEILLSLTIIGVVAAITLPSLTGNINERTWNTQRKALYARMSQAIALMPALNGYGTVTEGDSSTSAIDTAAETFVTEGLSKVLKINNICDNEHLSDCGIPTKVIDTLGSVAFSTIPETFFDYNSYFHIASYSTQINTKAAAFETQNGESILVYYNPYCKPYMNEVGYHVQGKVCANFVYDLNGSKGPNTFGKDIGSITALFPTDPVVVAPIPFKGAGGVQAEAKRACKQMDGRLPNNFELISIFTNRKIIGLGDTIINSWSSESPLYVMVYTIGMIRQRGGDARDNTWCVERN